MNKVQLIGRLTGKPELRYTSSNLPYTRFSIAVNRNFTNSQGQREADFINIIVWRKQAENVCKYTTKGSLVGVDGRIQTRSYDAQDGSKRYVTEVIADNVTFLGSKSSNSGYSQDDVPNYDDSQVAPTEKKGSDISEDPFKDYGSEVALSDDDLPF